MKTELEKKPFWEIPCNPITMKKVNQNDNCVNDKNAYNKKYHKLKNQY